jgi:primosomal protein N' (replication factor Y) (superfamily II helicase)
MVAKGLDFPDVTLVGVIAADTVLGLPDFRSGERTFQLLTQVAGRAGRHVLPGEVFVQTYMPEHYAIVAASGHDFAEFAREELHTRESHGYPPYHKMMLITFTHELVQPLMQSAEAFVRDLRVRFTSAGSEGEDGRRWSRMEAFGPVASPIPKLKDRYRFQCMVKYREESLASRFVMETIGTFEERFAKDKIGWSIDVDPQYLM